MVGDHKTHLAVGQHRGLGLAGGARGVEEPQRVVVVHADLGRRRAQVLLHQRLVARIRSAGGAGVALAYPDHMAQRVGRGTHRRGMLGKHRLDQHQHRAAGFPQIGHLARREPEVGRHPDTAHAKRRPAALEHRQVVARLQQDTVAFFQTECQQRGHQRVHPRVDLVPGPALFALDQCGVRREQPGGVPQQARQVADLRRVHGSAHAVSSTLR